MLEIPLPQCQVHDFAIRRSPKLNSRLTAIINGTEKASHKYMYPSLRLLDRYSIHRKYINHSYILYMAYACACVAGVEAGHQFADYV